jgi:hypothetical protein
MTTRRRRIRLKTGFIKRSGDGGGGGEGGEGGGGKIGSTVFFFLAIWLLY